MDKTEHTHPKNGLAKVYKMASKASKKRSIAVQKRWKLPKMVKKTEHCHPVIPGWMKIC